MSVKCGIICSVHFCKNYSWQKDARSFFRFPRDRERCAIWVDKCKREDLDHIFKIQSAEYLNKNNRICSDHFQLSDFNNPNLKSQGLKRTAIPSLNLIDPSSENLGQNAVKKLQKLPKRRIRLCVREATGSSMSDKKGDSPSPAVSVNSLLSEFLMESQNSSVTCNKDARMDSKTVIKEEPWLLQEDLAEVKSELNGSPFVNCEVENKMVPFESHFIAETDVHSDHLETVIKVEIKEEPSWIENGSTEPKLESEEAPILADDFQNEEKDSASWKIGMCEDFSRPESPRLHTEAVCNNDSNTPTLIIGTLKDEQCLKVTEEDYDDKRDDACKDHVKGETKKLLIVTSAFSLRLHKCEVCGKTFSHASNLKQHNLIHEGIKPYKCEICEKSYTRISYLNVHKLSHEDNRPYKCEVCGKTFTLSSYLKMHSVSHESKKTHKCEVCEKRFMFLFELEKHSLTHKGRKLHKCKFCDRSFTRASHLKGHILIHEGIRPYECEICKKSFTVMSNLKIHNMIHENERPYKCKVCNKGFIQLSHLKRHNLIHEGEKPYKCEICDKGFVQLSHLRRHNLIHET